MVDIQKLELSNELNVKLKAKNITSLNDSEFKLHFAITNGKNVAFSSSLSARNYIVPFVNKLENIKKLKKNRKPRIIVIVGNQNLCDEISEEIKSFLTKELIIVTAHENTSLKKNKKKFGNSVDIVIGTSRRLTELLNLDVLKIKNVKNIVLSDFENLNFEELTDLMSSIINSKKDETSTEHIEKKSKQIVVRTCAFNKSLKLFFEKFTDGSYETICEKDSNDSDDSDDSSEDSKEVAVKINGNKDNVSDNEVNEDLESDEQSSDDGIVDVDNEIKMDENLFNRIKQVNNEDKYNKIAKVVINEFGDVSSVSRLLYLITSESETKETLTNKSTPINSGPGSKLTGRIGYTAYHFIADKEISSKGYLFKSLKRLIDEEAVEKIERIQQTKDLKAFVFDLPSELDETFQNNWRDGKYDIMQLLEGEIPELVTITSDSFRGRGNDRGGYRGRGNDRGGFRGKSNDRGGFRGRGGRGTFKRPASFSENGNSKVVKFD